MNQPYRGVSTYSGALPRATDPAAPTPGTGLPAYRWPSQRAETPQRCAYCGSRLLLGDVPTADDPTVRVTCFMCSREACELVRDGFGTKPLTPAQMHPPRGRPRGSTPRVRPPCDDCGARPALTYSIRCLDCAAARRTTAAARVMAESRARRAAGLAPWSRHYAACLDCGKTTRPYHARGRCTGCYDPWDRRGRP